MKKRHVYIWVALTFGFIFTFMVGCSRQLEVSEDDLVATWGDTAMTVANFKERMLLRHRNEAAASQQPYSERMSILTEYCERDLKLLEGRRLGYDKRHDVQKAARDAIERRAVDLLYNKEIRDRFITRQMLEDFYNKDQWEVRARHILISIPEGIKGKDTLTYWQRIKEVHDKAVGGENFENLVVRYSEDESVDPKFRGDLGYFNWGKMVDEFQEAAWKLEKPGDISPIVRTRYGYHIIQLIAKRPSDLQVRTSHILVSVTRRADPAETTAAWERAKMVLEEARKPGADFAQLARRYSEDDKAWVNGDLGWLPRGSMPTEYWETALEMQPGDIAGPIRTYKGYHIIKATDRRVERAPLDDYEMSERIYSRLNRIYRDTLQSIAEVFLDSVMQSYNMRYNDSAVKLLLRKLNDSTSPDGMNRFSLLTAEERAMNIVDDNLGGIPIDTLAQMYGDHRFPPNYRNDVEFIKEMLDPILIPRYLSAMAREKGFFDHPEAIKDGKRALDNAILPEVEKDMVFNKATPTDDKVEEYYKKNIDKFRTAATATAWEIMIDSKQLADELLQRIKEGENISKLARRYSLRERAQRTGGKLGPFTMDQYGSVSREAFKLQEGEVAGPIKLGDMYVIIQLIEKTPEKIRPLEEVRSQIEGDLRIEQQRSIQQAWVAELRKFYNFKVYEDRVRAVWPILEQLPEPMVEERKVWKEDRRLVAEKARRKAEEDRIRLRLQPGSEQTFQRDGKEIKVKIGEPRYVDKDGNEVKSTDSNVKLTPKGKVETTTPKKSEATGNASSKKPTLKIEPVTKDKK